MKILQILRRFSFEEWGGTETVVWNVSRHLQEMGHRVEIAATSAFGHHGFECNQGIPIRRFKYFYPILGLSPEDSLALDRKGGNPYSLGLYRYLGREEKVDIYHCHSMQRLANLVRLAAVRRRIPYVVSFQGGYRELLHPELLEMSGRRHFWFNYGGLIDFFLGGHRYMEMADGIVCVDYDDFLTARQRFPHLPVEYFPNGVDIKRFSHHNGVDFRAAYGIPADRQLLLCVSRIDYPKNQRILLEMTQRLAENRENPHLVLIGPVASESYYQQLWGEIAGREIGDRVTIIRGLRSDDPRLVAAYQAADCFVLPSIHEPFGIVVLEAWAAGVPVICSGAGGLRRLVRDGETGLFFNDFSCEDLLHKYYALKHEPDLAPGLVKHAAAEVAGKYSWEIITAGLSDYYRRVIRHYRRRYGIPGSDPDGGTEKMILPDA